MELVLAEKDDLYKLSYVYLRNRADCEDVLQDLVILLIDNINKLRNPDAFYPWVRKILLNCCYKKLNRPRKIFYLNFLNDRHSPHDLNSVEPLGHCKSDFALVDSQIDLLNALDHLSKLHKDVVVLHYFSDLTLDNVAQVLSVPSGTVKSRLHKALSLLRKHLGGDKE